MSYNNLYRKVEDNRCQIIDNDRPVERVRKHAQDPYSATLGHTKTYGEPNVIWKTVKLTSFTNSKLFLYKILQINRTYQRFFLYLLWL